MLETIRYHLANLTNFRGRDDARQFWPYAALVIVIAFVGMTIVMASPMADTMARMQNFAAEHPELATVQSGPGHYSISIQGHHPELMPDMPRLVAKIGLVAGGTVLLLAASVARRLHDRGKSALWGLPPVLFLFVALAVMPRLFVASDPDIGLFFLLFFNNIFYLISLAWLVVLLAGGSVPGRGQNGD